MIVTEDSVCVVHNCANLKRIKIDGTVFFCCETAKDAAICDPDFFKEGAVHKITECNNVSRR